MNTTHASTKIYLPSDNDVQYKINRKSRKGCRLIILHTITIYGYLVKIVLEIPFSDLKWKCDTPHPEPRSDGKLTAETLWLAQSHTGDYHDNMNSETCMQ